MGTFQSVDHASPPNIGDIKIDANIPSQLDVDFDFQRFEALFLEAISAIRSIKIETHQTVPEIRFQVPEPKPAQVTVTPSAPVVVAPPLVTVQLPWWPIVFTSAVFLTDVLVRVFWVR